MKNFYQAFKNIVSTSGRYKHFSENPASGNYDIDLIGYVLSLVLIVKRLVKNYR
jgi:hypothetical protein